MGRHGSRRPRRRREEELVPLRQEAALVQQQVSLHVELVLELKPHRLARWGSRPERQRCTGLGLEHAALQTRPTGRRIAAGPLEAHADPERLPQAGGWPQRRELALRRGQHIAGDGTEHAGARVGDDGAVVAARGEGDPAQFVEREHLGAGDVQDPA